LGEIAERDIIVLYELPCPVNTTRAKDDDSATHVVLPVYHSAAGARMYSQDLFGIPIYLALPLEDSTSAEAIYAALVERYAPWSLNPQQLYKRTVAIPESTTPSGESPQETSDGDEMEEQDVTEMKLEQDQDHDMLPESREPSESREETITNLGPQDNLFAIKIYAPIRGGGYSYASGLMSDPLRGLGETLTERATSTKKKTATYFKWSQSSTPEPPELLNGKKQLITSEDTIVCEWDPNMLDFFFGIAPSKGYKKEENSHWEQWETFEHPDYVAAVKAKKATKERGITLEDCLDEFTKEERLGEDDLWYCPQCKKHQQATKKFELWKVPDVLVVHLKRFSNSRFLRDKIDSFVDFPIEGLDLGERVEERLVAKKWIEEGNDLESLGISDASTKEPLLYDLYAVDEHLGGLGGGHYRAYAKNFEDDNWYHFDDTHVTNSTAKASVVCTLLSIPRLGSTSALTMF
jgi:ubiquitin carboxyl-terminal hydrolase 4/11/15